MGCGLCAPKAVHEATPPGAKPAGAPDLHRADGSRDTVPACEATGDVVNDSLRLAGQAGPAAAGRAVAEAAAPPLRVAKAAAPQAERGAGAAHGSAAPRAAGAALAARQGRAEASSAGAQARGDSEAERHRGGGPRTQRGGGGGARPASPAALAEEALPGRVPSGSGASAEDESLLSIFDPSPPLPPPVDPPAGYVHEVDKNKLVAGGSFSSDDDLPRAAAAGLCSSAEISLATRMLLLTWARWGRNSARIKEEEKLKALQHTKYPKCPRPLLTPVVSPQPTPRLTDAERMAAADGEQGMDHGSPRSRLAPRPARIGILPPDWEGVKGGALLFETLRKDQREAMNEQGVKVKLSQTLGPATKQGNSVGTPGFGVETPSFVGAASRGSASAEASIVSSGVASPMQKGQLSPWILEAEALVDDNDGSEHSSRGEGRASADAWGIAPAALLHEGLTTVQAKQPHRWEQPLDAPIDGGDELDQVEMFVNAGLAGASFEPCAERSTANRVPQGPGEAGQAPRERTAARALPAPNVAVPSVAVKRHTQGTEPSPAEPPKEPPAPGVALPEYAPGEAVSYWSKTHGAWMPARIVERKSKSVYLVDKQNLGCLSKMRASSLMSAAEMQRDPVLRALEFLGEDRRGGSGAQSAQRRSASAASAGRPGPSSSPQKRAPGRVVRDDFSDDDDG